MGRCKQGVRDHESVPERFDQIENKPERII
jgi:hypothetical protein